MRTLSLVVVVAAVAVNLFAAGLADERRARDPRDFEGDLDIRKVIQTHGPSGTVRHAIRTHGRWRGRDLRDFRVSFDFSIDKPRDIERSIRIKSTRHGYAATMYSGRHLQNKRRGHIGVWRRDRHSIRISFSAKLLRRRHLSRYWWNAWTGYVNCPVGEQEPEPCIDAAPKRLLEHDLR